MRSLKVRITAILAVAFAIFLFVKSDFMMQVSANTVDSTIGFDDNKTSFENINLPESSDPIDGMTIKIDGYITGKDEMSFPTNGTYGITVDDRGHGHYLLTGSDQIEDYKNFIYHNDTIFKTSNTVLQEREIIFTLGTAFHFEHDDGKNHYYQFITTDDIEPNKLEGDGQISWHNAKDDAASRTFNGLKGYLATITSRNENLFITNIIQGNGWIGAVDIGRYNMNNPSNPFPYDSTNSNHGKWTWVTGPEADTQFYDGYTNGNGVDNRYSNWLSGEPNNFTYGGAEGIEFVAHMYSGRTNSNGGTWNDYPNTGVGGREIKGYIIEYGGMPSDDLDKLSESITKVQLVHKNPLQNLIDNAKSTFPNIDKDGEYLENDIKAFKDALNTLADENADYDDVKNAFDALKDMIDNKNPKLSPLDEDSLNPNDDGYLKGLEDEGTYKVKVEPNGDDFVVTIDDDGDYTVYYPNGDEFTSGNVNDQPSGILMPDDWIGEELSIQKVYPVADTDENKWSSVTPSESSINDKMKDADRESNDENNLTPINFGDVDWNNHSITVDPAEDDQEYALFDDNGQLLQGWVKPTDGKVIFDGLDPGTEYEVQTRKPGNNGTYPSKPLSMDVTTDKTDNPNVADGKKDIDDRAKKAKDAIDTNPNLTDDEKDALKNKVDEQAKKAKEEIGEATDPHKDFDEILGNFDAKVGLIEKTAEALDAVEEGDDHLTPTQKRQLVDNLNSALDDYLNELNGEIDPDTIAGIVDNASDDIDAKKDIINRTNKALEDIDKNPNLSDGEKEKLKGNIVAPLGDHLDAIDKAQTPGERKDITDGAIGDIDAKQAVIDRTSDAIQGVKDNDDLSNDEKALLIKALEDGLNDELDAIDKADNPNAVKEARDLALARVAAKDRYMEEYSNLDPKQRKYVTDKGIFAQGLEDIANEDDPAKLEDDGETLVTAIQNLYRGALEQVKGSPLTDEEWENTRKNLDADGALDAYKKDLTNVLYNKLSDKEKEEVDKFIKDHLTDGDDIITAITNFFRKNAVMTGEDPWNNFSDAQKEYINAFLSMHGYDDGFPGLLAEAKASPYTKLGEKLSAKLAQTGDNYINVILNSLIALSIIGMGVTYFIRRKIRVS